MSLLLIKFQSWFINKRRKKVRICNECNAVMIPVKEISVINIAFYAALGFIIYMLTKSRSALLLPVPLSIINSRIVKGKCPKCKSLDFREYATPVAKEEDVIIDAEIIEE